MEWASSIAPVLTTRHLMQLAKWLPQGHEAPMRYQENSRALPTPSTVLFRGSWIRCTTNIQLLMRFFSLNIKRNILYKSKHKGSIMKRENKPQIWRRLDTLYCSAYVVTETQDSGSRYDSITPNYVTFSKWTSLWVSYLFISQMGIISATSNAWGFGWSSKSIYSIVLGT